MDLDRHWRTVRRLRAKGLPVPNTPEENASFREAVFARIGGDWFRELSNADFAQRLNALGLMTFQGRSWDATSARTFRQALEADIVRTGEQLEDEAQRESRRVKAIKDRAVAAILRSQSDDQPLHELEQDIRELRLDLVEDRNAGLTDVLNAVEYLERRLAKRLTYSVR